MLLNLFTRQNVCDKKFGRVLEVFSTQARPTYIWHAIPPELIPIFRIEFDYSF